MALRKIVEVGDPCLAKVCRPVTAFNSRLHALLDDMTETLAEVGGAGLAAPQVGILRRAVIVLDEESETYLELVNPEIVKAEGEQTGLEGCLSVPGKWGIVTRPAVVRPCLFGVQPRHSESCHRPLWSKKQVQRLLGGLFFDALRKAREKTLQLDGTTNTWVELRCGVQA